MRSIYSTVFFILFIIHASSSFSQQKGIKFVANLNWEQIQKEALKEKKYIFVDCYATWCGPCKSMDRNVYTNDTIGEFFNDHFISVKMQMDSTLNDPSNIRKLYPDANKIRADYNITALPTFLFFSPDGKVVHKAVGYLKVSDFLTLGNDAIVKDKQNYTWYNAVLEKRSEEDVEISKITNLVKMAKSMDEKGIGHDIAINYIENRLLKLKENRLFTKTNIRFIADNTESTDEPGFIFFEKNVGRIDETMESAGYAHDLICYLITNDYINPQIMRAKSSGTDSINWKQLYSMLSAKYKEEYIDQALIAAKKTWFADKGDWNNYSKYAVLYLNKFGKLMNAYDLTSNVWFLFVHSTDKDELKVGIKWIKVLLKQDPFNDNLFDTYANLLYKSGDTKKALELEEKAIQLAPKVKIYKNVLEKMKAGEPTW